MTAFLRAIALVAALVLLARADPAGAVEEILDFDVDIEVSPDGELTVTERIRVTVEGDQIKRGLLRDFPLERSDSRGGSGRVTFEVDSVRRNGEAEPYKVLDQGDQARVRIGVKDRLLPTPSEQTYAIRYRTQGQLRDFEEFGELYWNVTGDQWTFPIRAASVDIRLPGDVEIIQHAAYTGPYGAQGRDFEVLEVSRNRFRAATTATLRPGEGFTVAIGWPVGAIATPQAALPPSDSQARFAAVGATLVGAAALLFAWVMVGRDPQGGAIYARFEPPESLGPAAACYVQNMGFDSRCLTAAIISLAVKGALRIVDRPSDGIFASHFFALEAQGSKYKPLTAGERAVYRALFSGKQRVELTSDKTNGPKVERARKELRSALWDEHYGASFRRNFVYTALAALVGPAALLLLYFFGGLGGTRLDEWLLSAVVSGVVTYGLGFLVMELTDLRRGNLLRWKRLAGTLFPLAVMSFMFFNFMNDIQRGGVAGLIERSDLLVVAAGIVFGTVVALFHFLMSAPTKAGRALMDQIEGFALYLRTAEESRLDILNPPERTPDLFERLLPYAVALGLSHQWGAKFAGVLTSTATPDWYDGSGHFNADSFDRSFSNSVASTSTPSSGSSGSGGGGFSGGGGGGGGGSGW